MARRQAHHREDVDRVDRRQRGLDEQRWYCDQIVYIHSRFGWWWHGKLQRHGSDVGAYTCSLARSDSRTDARAHSRTDARAHSRANDRTHGRAHGLHVHRGGKQLRMAQERGSLPVPILARPVQLHLCGACAHARSHANSYARADTRTDTDAGTRTDARADTRTDARTNTSAHAHAHDGTHGRTHGLHVHRGRKQLRMAQERGPLPVPILARPVQLHLCGCTTAAAARLQQRQSSGVHGHDDSHGVGLGDHMGFGWRRHPRPLLQLCCSACEGGVPHERLTHREHARLVRRWLARRKAGDQDVG